MDIFDSLSPPSPTLPCKRPHCPQCLRPLPHSCWCSHLPSPPLETKRTVLVILQHPQEEKKGIRTARMLELGLDSSSCKLIRGKKFNGREEKLSEVLRGEGVTPFLLFPGEGARDLEQVRESCEAGSRRAVIFILDGTWEQAKKMYAHSKFLQEIPKVCLSVSTPSEYVVRQAGIHITIHC